MAKDALQTNLDVDYVIDYRVDKDGEFERKGSYKGG